MEITINKEDLNIKLVDFFTNNVRNNSAQQGLDDEETAANIILTRKRVQADADQITNLVFAVYGVNEEPAESAE